MNLKFLSVYLIAIIVCVQPVFGFVDILFGVASNGYKAISYIKSHWGNDASRVLEKVSVKNTGNGCTQVMQKLKGQNTYINYHIDQGVVYDIVYAAANNGHTFQTLLETLTDKLKSQGKGNYVLEVATVNERVVKKQYSCPSSVTKWTGKIAEYDYHIVLSDGGKCSKMWSVLKDQSKKYTAEVRDYNESKNPC